MIGANEPVENPFERRHRRCDVIGKWVLMVGFHTMRCLEAMLQADLRLSILIPCHHVHALALDLTDVVHQAEQLPLRVHFGLAT